MQFTSSDPRDVKIKELTETNQTLLDSMHALAKIIREVREALKDDAITKLQMFEHFITKERLIEIVGRYLLMIFPQELTHYRSVHRRKRRNYKRKG